MRERSRARSEAACVGLDIGSYAIKAVELVRRADEVLIRAADSVRTPPGAVEDGAIVDRSAVSGALRQLWRRGGFVSRQAHTAIDLRQVTIRWQILEVDEGQSLDELAHQASVRGLPYPAHEAISDYRVLSTRERRGRLVHHILLAAARARAVEDALDAIEGAGIEALSADIAPMAILRCGSSQQKRRASLWTGQPEAHCVIGCESTLICITRDAGLEFSRNIPVGSRQITQMLAQELNCPEAEAETSKTAPTARIEADGTLHFPQGERLARACIEPVLDRLVREIGRSLRHFQSQFPEGSYLGMIGRVFLSGGGVRLRGLDRCLSERLSDEIDTLNPFSGLSVIGTSFGVDKVQGATPAYSLAMGLALGYNSPAPAQAEGMKAA